MHHSYILGIFLVVAGGIAQGAFMAPSKWMRDWHWENYWLVFSLISYLVLPWSGAMLMIPRLFSVYTGAPASALFSVVLFGSAWGLGALSFGLGIEAVGMSLGYAVILSVATIVGTAIPFLFIVRSGFSLRQMFETALAVTVMILAVVLCSLAGKWRDATPPAFGPKKYGRGILLCIGSGILSSGGNLGLFFSTQITERAVRLGVPETLAPTALWTLLTVPLFVFNFGYALSCLRKRDTIVLYRIKSLAMNIGLSALMGVLWMGGLSLYGTGTRELGRTGTSLGFALFMGSTVLASTGIGIAAGEWSGASCPAKKQLRYGIVLLLVALCCLADANR